MVGARPRRPAVARPPQNSPGQLDSPEEVQIHAPVAVLVLLLAVLFNS